MHIQKKQDSSHHAALLETIEDAGRRLGVGRSTIYDLLRTGQLEAVKIGRSRRVVIASTVKLVERLRNEFQA
jgi:excisionase family DNA binding protein